MAAYYPNAQLILDTVDVHWLRETRSIGIIDGYTEEKVALNKAREIAVYEQADRVWAVTEVDKKEIIEVIPTAKVDIISNVHQPEISTYTDNGKKALLFFGSYKHEPNISAVKILAETIFPKIKAIFPNAQLIIAGANAPKEIIELGQLSGVIYKGFIEEKDLANLYKDAFLVVAPLLAGAGIKGKICEAIAFRTPVVTTAIGNEGIDLLHETEGLIAEPSEMAAVIIKALKRDYDFEQMTEKAATKLAELVGEQAVKKNLLQAFYPVISICIVTWNGLALLKKCVTSIFENTNYPNYKILVYSNACTDGTIDYLKKLAVENKRVLPIFSKTNEVFVLPNNKMMKLFPTNEVILLNNDTQVKPNWLIELHRAAYANKSIGIAGSKVLYPDGRLQEFGAILYEQGHGQNIGKGDDPEKAAYQTPNLVGYVSGCAMYIKRSTIEKIGVFDEQFHPCYYEDSDYCYTAAENKLQTIVTPHSQIYHEEGATAGQDTNTGFKRYQTVNRAKFIQKHKGKNNGIQWSNSPLTTDHSSLKTYKAFIFTHIPKCGGTSFRQFINQAALANGVGAQEIFIPGFNGLPNAKNLEQLNAEEQHQLRQQPIKILANHSKFEEHTKMGIHLEIPFYYTLLREPVSRFISHYNFFYYQQGLADCKGIKLEDLPKEKRSQLIQKLANLQIIYLTNSVVGTTVDENLYQTAKYNLQNYYADFGILEDMDNAIKRLKRKLPNWLKSKAVFPILNQNKKSQSISVAIIEEIKSANYWDEKLYNWAIEKTKIK